MKIQFFRHFFPFFLKKKFCGRIFSFVGKNDLFVAFAMANVNLINDLECILHSGTEYKAKQHTFNVEYGIINAFL